MVSALPENASPAEIVQACNDLIEQRRGHEAVEQFIADEFIEHDPQVKGGNKDGFLQFLIDEGWTEPGGPDYTFVMDRVISTGEYVVTHQHVTEGPNDPVLVFIDIYRVRDGKLVEHWHVGQQVPKNPINTALTMY